MARHGSLAEQLSALRRYITEPDHEPEPIETNWSVVPVNDNNPEDIADLKHDRKRLVTPSVAEIMRNVRTGDIERNEAGQIIRIGKLQFSDGNQREKAYRLTIDGGVEAYQARMPTGAMLRTRDQVDVALGGDENPQDVTLSNQYFADMFGTVPHRYLSANKRPKAKHNISRDESKAILDAAYANTDMRKVTFTKCPDALPCGSASVADSFLGMRKASCAGGGAVMWQDIVSARAARKVWRDSIDTLGDKDRAVLEAARTAKTYADVSPGGSSRGARKRGKRFLTAANDNLADFARKLSA